MKADRRAGPPSTREFPDSLREFPDSLREFPDSYAELGGDTFQTPTEMGGLRT